MSLLPEWAPNIHPLLVHFPIALLVTAGILNLAEILLPYDWWDERKSTILYAAGAVSAIAVYFTGQSAADQVFLETAAQPVLTDHADWALWTVWYFGGYAMVRSVLHRLDWLQRKDIRILAFLAVLPGLFFLYETGEHGAELVFGYGTGTGQLVQRQAAPAVSDSLVVKVTDTFDEAGNGDWSWKMGPGAVGSLLSRFHWLQGEAGQLDASAVELGKNNYGLQIGLKDGINLFAGTRDYGNIQMDLYMDLSGFEGELELVHHLQDSTDYDFVGLASSGAIVQGRRRDGEYTVFAEGTFNPERNIFLRVVSDGSHFRAYVNRQLKTHGHGESPPPGKVGIRLEGSGRIRIDSIELSHL